jgi:hypothetical protein
LNRIGSSKDKSAEIIADARRSRKQREQGYRDRALKMYPWLCARCGREFEGQRVRELTVHHKDHDHDNNPLDGSNWELLCLYCHDNEHSRHDVADAYDQASANETEKSSTSKYKPFEDLASLLIKKTKK